MKVCYKSHLTSHNIKLDFRLRNVIALDFAVETILVGNYFDYYFPQQNRKYLHKQHSHWLGAHGNNPVMAYHIREFSPSCKTSKRVFI